MSSEVECPLSKVPRLSEERDNNLLLHISCLPNPHLDKLDSDLLYHLGYEKKECSEKFSDVKYVVTGGSGNRMAKFAEFIAEKLDLTSEEISLTDRFRFFKIGPVISISHGMGVPSITIMLHEMIKLLHYAGAEDPIIIRIGTSGGLGVEPGTVVVTNKSFNAFLEEKHELVILGKRVLRDALINQELAKEIFSHSCEEDGYSTVLGGTMCTDDFYEGQARLDGVMCEHSEEEKMSYLKMLRKNGVYNIEMECTALTSLCLISKIKCADVCVTLLDRLNGDQVDIPLEMYKEYQQRPLELVGRFIAAGLSGKSN